MKVMMNTGRTIRQGSLIEKKTSDSYADETSSCMMNPLDMLDLDVEAGDHVRAVKGDRSVVLSVVPDEEISLGAIFVPLGPYANFVINSDTHGTGMPDYKTTLVDLTPTDDPVPSVSELMSSYGGLWYE